MAQWRREVDGARAGDHPPKEEEGFLEFARSLPQPDIYNAISQAEPLSPISQYARTENLRRRYDKASCPVSSPVTRETLASVEQGVELHHAAKRLALHHCDPFECRTPPRCLSSAMCQVEKLPDGLCVLGDACASFNPTYGQGMTVGIKGAVLMRNLLQKRLGNAKFGPSNGPAALQGFTKVRTGVALLCYLQFKPFGST